MQKYIKIDGPLDVTESQLKKLHTNYKKIYKQNGK